MVMDKSAQQQQHQHQIPRQQTPAAMSPSSDDALPTSGTQQAPNAAAVGREFVRQYYTLLNQAPLHLHRFYSANSSFVHGSLDGGGGGGGGGGINSPEGSGGGGELEQAVRGQQEIHQRIMALGFRNCRAKIRQVDSHATLGDGVVVQVAGELSNDDRPHRRFMQTFVLAPQSHKKYYVHNDIFRYQDEVFGDSVASSSDGISSPPTVSVDPASRPKSNGEGHAMEKREAAANMKQPALAPAPAGMATQQPVAAAAAAEASVLAQAAETLQKQQAAAAAAQAQFQVEQKKEAPATAAAAQSAVVPVVPPQVEKSVEENGSAGAVEQPARKPMPGQAKAHQPLHKEISAPPALGPQQPAAAAAVPASAPQPPPAAPAEPMSYASLVKTGPSAAAAAATSGDTSGKSDQRPRGGYGEPPKSDEAAAGGVKAAQHQTGAVPMRPGGAPGGSGVAPGGGPRSSVGGGGIGSERGMGGGPIQYPDGQQLFVGNLPHNCTDDDLRELFGQYGKVADIRISNKGAAQSKQQPAGTRVPNFGFVSFEEARAVQKVLSHLERKPIFLYDNHRLNVEEKKTKIRSENSVGDRISGGGPMGGNLPESRGGGRGHHHGGGGGRGDGGFDQHQRGGSQEYSGMGRGMMGEGRGRGGSSVRGGGPMGRGGPKGGGGPSQSGQFKKKPPFGNPQQQQQQQQQAANSHM